jgi:hypothetical protein
MAVLKCDVKFLGLASRNNYEKGAARTMREIQKGDAKGEIEDIRAWCRRLYAYVYWKEDDVQTLSTKTSLSELLH